MQRMSAHLWPSQKLALMKMDAHSQLAAAAALAGGQKGWTSLYETVAEEEQMKREKRAKRREYIIYAVAISALLALVGLLMFFLWPRVPSVRVVDVFYDDGADLNQPLGPRLANLNQETTFLPKDFPGAKRDFLGVRLRVELRITSSNFLTLPIDDLNVLVRTEGLDFGAGSLEEPTKLKARGSTRMSIPIDLMLQGGRGSNSFIDLLRGSCSPNPSARKPIAIDYHAIVHVNPLESLGIQPPILHGAFDLDCPWSMDEALARSNSNSTLKRRFWA